MMDLESLWSQYRDAIERAICQVCATWHVEPDAADEMAQELRLCTLEHDAKVLCAYQGQSAIGTYLYRVLTRRAGRWIRRRTRTVIIEKPCGDPFAWEVKQSTESLIADCSTDHGERNRAALHALRTLTSVEQELIRLRFGRGLHWDEVAAFTGLSRKAAENRMYRALDKLRRAAQPKEGRKEGRKDDASSGVSLRRCPTRAGFCKPRISPPVGNTSRREAGTAGEAAGNGSCSVSKVPDLKIGRSRAPSPPSA